MDRAVFFGLSARLWGLCSGPVTAILVAVTFTPEVQGFYFTFGTIVALQVFIELGLGTVIIQFASHEWSKLSLDASGRIAGDRASLSRLVSIAKFASKWYLAGAVLLVIGLGAGGWFFFAPVNSAVSWVSPWLLLCLVTGLEVCLVPVWSLLEGCNQLVQLYRFRFLQGLIASLSTWAAILLGAGLWTAPISVSAALLVSIYFIGRRYRTFLTTLLLSRSDGPRIAWRSDMLPMQWRIALSWIGGYFVFSLFVPVLFKYDGPVAAGQMGMTWSMVAMIGAVTSAWVSPRAPRFGMLIARKEYGELDRQLRAVTRIVVGVSALLALTLWLLVLMLNALDHDLARHLASRLLAPLPTGVFLVAHCVMLATTPASAYLRAHKKEPLMMFSVTYAALVGCSTFFLGRHFSVMGMAAGYLIVNALSMPVVFLIWHRCRKAWHTQ